MMNSMLMKPAAWILIVLMVGSSITLLVSGVLLEGIGPPVEECFRANPRTTPTSSAMFDGYMNYSLKGESVDPLYARAVFHYSIELIVAGETQLMGVVAAEAPCISTTTMLNYWIDPEPAVSKEDIKYAINEVIQVIEDRARRINPCAQENITTLRKELALTP